MLTFIQPSLRLCNMTERNYKYQCFRKKVVPFHKPVVYHPISRKFDDLDDALDWLNFEKEQWLSECGRKKRRHHFEWVVMEVGEEISVK